MEGSRPAELSKGIVQILDDARAELLLFRHRVWLADQPALERLVEPLHLPAGLGPASPACKLQGWLRGDTMGTRGLPSCPVCDADAAFLRSTRPAYEAMRPMVRVVDLFGERESFEDTLI